MNEAPVWDATRRDTSRIAHRAVPPEPYADEDGVNVLVQRCLRCDALLAFLANDPKLDVGARVRTGRRCRGVLS